ncbi:hypothetical protein BSKO_13256 [Bryopsis sp. KO-2023]|nr:hypothetical protein BSKO_13256 [Bryopsis sp. KO-2023]
MGSKTACLLALAVLAAGISNGILVSARPFPLESKQNEGNVAPSPQQAVGEDADGGLYEYEVYWVPVPGSEDWPILFTRRTSVLAPASRIG